MTKKFVILQEHEIQDVMVNNTGLVNANVVPIYDTSEVETGYYILGVTNIYSDSLVGYKRFTEAEVKTARDTIRSGGNVETFIPHTQKNSTFTDAAGADAVYQGIGIVSTASPSVTWTAPVALNLTGIEIWVNNAEVGDHVKLEVIHPVDGNLGAFADTWYIADGARTYMISPSGFIKDEQIKITLTKGSGNTAATDIIINGMFYTV